MSRVYCSLEDVKRLLRSVITRESKIRFSEALKSLKADSNNNGSILLSQSGITFEDSFAEHETYTFEFTDSTSFEVEGDVVGYLGSGNRFSDFVLDEKFTVSSSAWSGSALVGDKIYFTSASDMSNDDGNSFIVDSTNRINARLERIYGTLENVAFYDSTSVDIPHAINFACIRYTAYDIFNSVFAGISTDENSPVERWKRSAEETLDQYISSHGRGPVWKSRKLLMVDLGVSGIGEGLIEIDQLSDPKNKQYER